MLNNPLTQIVAPGGDVLARSLSPGTRLVTADGRHPGDPLGKMHHSGPSLRQSAPHDGASRRKRPRRRNCNLKMDGYRTRRPDQPCNGQQSRASHCNQYLDRTSARCHTRGHCPSFRHRPHTRRAPFALAQCAAAGSRVFAVLRLPGGGADKEIADAKGPGMSVRKARGVWSPAAPAVGKWADRTEERSLFSPPC